MNSLLLPGVKVVDFTHDVAGPFCTMLLGDLGAEVIKVERPEIGDESRSFPMLGPSEFLAVNRNKKSLTLNIKASASKEILKRLLREADVLVENFRPGTMDRLGLGYESVKQMNPRLIYCSISGFGQDGPYRDRGAWDPVIQALIGIQSTTGEEGQRPVRIGASVFDASTGLYGALAIMGALFAREKTGKGQRIDISMLDCGLTLMTYWIPYCAISGRLPPKMGTGWPSFAPYEIFRARDRDIFLAASSERLWRDFCNAMNLEDLMQDQRFATNEQRLRNRKILHEMIDSTFSKLSAKEIVDKLGPMGIPCAPIYTVEEAVNDPQVKHRKMILNIDYNGHNAKVAGIPLKFSDTELTMRLEPPPLSGHSAEILRGLGYSETEIVRLRNDSVI